MQLQSSSRTEGFVAAQDCEGSGQSSDHDENILMKALQRLCEVDSFEDLVKFLQETVSEYYVDCNEVHCFKVSKCKLDDIYDATSDQAVTSTLICSCRCAPKRILLKTISSDDVLVTKSYFNPSDSVRILILKSEKDRMKDDLMLMTRDSTLKVAQKDLEILLRHAATCYERVSLRHHDKTSCDQTANLLLSGELEKATDAISIQRILNVHLAKVTSAHNCCILIRANEIQQIVCQVIGDKKLNFEVFRSMDEGIFKEICNSDGSSFIKQHLTESEQQQLSAFLGTKVESILTLPVVHKSTNLVILYVCLFNKKHGERFHQDDIRSVDNVMLRTWRILESALVLQREIKSRQESEAMLQIAKNLFTNLGDVRLLLGEIIQAARNLTSAERCSVFLSDEETKELVATIFDGISTMDENVKEIRFPITQGIAGLVATTGKTLNIADVYQHPLFYKGVDEATGFRTRNILCFPIKDLNGKVVGVSQLCNKIKGPCFTSYDVEIAEKFSVFSGISISHSLLYKQVLESDARSKLANELMLYHMDIDLLDLHNYMKLCTSVESIMDVSPTFNSFDYKPRILNGDMKLVACVLMYDDLGLTARFHISRRTLVHFMLMVRKGYRDTPYHNWDHGFSVLHHAYLLIKNLKLNEIYEDTDIIALLTASVCHDLDHRGTNNSFQTSSKSVLADLYSSEGSVLERHHLAQTMCILNSAGCDIFENMTHNEYRSTLARIKHAILATDVATHLKLIPQFDNLARNLPLKFEESRVRDLTYSLCMTACDLSDSTKDWETITSTSQLIYKEFFSQGDMEKRMGNRPALMNDRERACLPELQINFMNFIAGPAYRLLSSFFDDYKHVYNNFQINLKRWKLVHQETSAKKIPNDTLFEYIADKDFDDIVPDIS